jgi:hypothetical protein
MLAQRALRRILMVFAVCNSTDECAIADRRETT